MRLLGRNWTRKLLASIFVLLVLLTCSYLRRVQLSSEDARRNQDSLGVVIVEEHQTALTYWMKAADKRVIPRFNNLLIHIDGHSDQGFLTSLPEMPVQFQWSNIHPQIGAFLQSNDIFVNGGVVTGLVSRFVWIFPSWDPEVLKKGRRYSRKEVQVGRLRNKAQDSLTDYLCACLIDEAGIKACEVDDPEVLGGEKVLKDLYGDLSETCSIEHTYLSEYVHEDLALELLNDPTWISPETSSVILDVDEDFFGCQLVGENLVKAGIRWKDIDHLDFLTGQLLCPSTLLEEELADSLIKELFALYYEICTWSDLDTCSTSTTELTARTMNRFLKVKTDNLKLFCLYEDRSRLPNTWVKLLEHLKSFTIKQLQAIIDTGFCLKTLYRHPSSFEDPGNFMVCHGHNTPDDNAVFLHSPKMEEIERRADLLKALFQSKGLLQTKLVTVARSVRDGYTPREYAKDIETRIIQGLQHSRTLNITYDEQLLCGRLGLSSRGKFVLA